MDKLELFRRTVADIGNVSAAALSAHLEKKYGVKIEPAFIPIFKATLLGLELTSKFRQDATPIPPDQPSQAA